MAKYQKLAVEREREHEEWQRQHKQFIEAHARKVSCNEECSLGRGGALRRPCVTFGETYCKSSTSLCAKDLANPNLFF